MNKGIIFATVLMIAGLSLISYAIYLQCSKQKNDVVYVEYFKKGDILTPDYAINDTLVVRDAIGLNKEVALFEQGIKDATDGEISETFYKYCDIK